MKTSTIPSLRVTPELRAAAESVLEQGETISSFLEHSVRLQIEKRVSQREFIARGIASRDRAMEHGEYYSAEDVLGELEELISKEELRTAK